MKKTILLIICIMTAFFTYGQSNYQDVVYLKNGSVIRGVIIEQVPNKSIKIQTADRSLFIYQMDDIEKFTKEEVVKNKNSFGSSNSEGFKSGYKGIIDFGYHIKAGEYGMSRLAVNIVNGYQFNPYFSLGLGTGLRYYFDSKATLLPMFSDFRINIVKGKISPLLALGIGYSFDVTNKFESVGSIFNPGIGVSIMLSEKSALNIFMGYEKQRMTFYQFSQTRILNISNGGSYYSYENNTKEFKANSGAITLNMGLSF